MGLRQVDPLSWLVVHLIQFSHLAGLFCYSCVAVFVYPEKKGRDSFWPDILAFYHFYFRLRPYPPLRQRDVLVPGLPGERVAVIFYCAHFLGGRHQFV